MQQTHIPLTWFTHKHDRVIDNFAEFLLLAVASIFKDLVLSPMVSITQFIVIVNLPLMVVFTGFTARFASLFVQRITNMSLRHALQLSLVWSFGDTSKENEGTTGLHGE